MLTFSSAAAVPFDQVPVLPMADFRQAVIGAVRQGGHVCSLFGMDTGQGQGVTLVVVVADECSGKLLTACARLGASFASLTPECPQVHLFEREIFEQFGIVPLGHPWLKPVRYHAPAAGGPRPLPCVTDYFRVEGEDVHEVAVGPIHAGVIEPGHFRFQCHGEDVFHLEISLGYQHRGIESQLFGAPSRRWLHFVETAAGDTTVGHATAYAQTLEALGGAAAPPRAQALRAIGLELERLANHTGDLGALAGDVGYLPVMSFCGRLRGDYLNMSALICGNRFGRGLVQPGGAGFDLDAERTATLRARLADTFKDTTGAAELLFDCTSVRARFEHTGEVSTLQAKELGLVGPAARASGSLYDVRTHFPAGAYAGLGVKAAQAMEGDVQARAMVRWLEIKESVRLIGLLLDSLPPGDILAPVGPAAPGSLAVSLVEGWRGEVCHAAITDGNGHILRYKMADPSFHNWTGLAMSLRGQQISDFPLCNKSFNLSYCGHDL